MAMTTVVGNIGPTKNARKATETAGAMEPIAGWVPSILPSHKAKE
jgi:hypothetical protein